MKASENFTYNDMQHTLSKLLENNQLPFAIFNGNIMDGKNQPLEKMVLKGELNKTNTLIFDFQRQSSPCFLVAQHNKIEEGKLLYKLYRKGMSLKDIKQNELAQQILSEINIDLEPHHYRDALIGKLLGYTDNDIKYHLDIDQPCDFIKKIKETFNPVLSKARYETMLHEREQQVNLDI
ncbi:MAG: hypothetical protein KTR28_07950 [Micavibrio sp.]|nr:hypothetical protein [Micavibrio sp.]